MVMLFIFAGELEWVREESLASIVTAEMVELPMSDTEAEMQAEFEAENCKFLDFTFNSIVVMPNIKTIHVVILEKSIDTLRYCIRNT